jgi:hypothetical protein
LDTKIDTEETEISLLFSLYLETILTVEEDKEKKAHTTRIEIEGDRERMKKHQKRGHLSLEEQL